MLRVLFSTVDYIRIIIIVTSLLNYKFAFTKKAGITAGISSVLYMIGAAAVPSQVDFFNFLLGIAVIVIVVFSVEGRKKALFSVAGFFIISLMDESVFLIASKITGVSYDELSTDKVWQSVLMGITLLIFLGIAFVIRAIYKRSSSPKLDLKNTNPFYLVLLSVGGLIALLTATAYNLQSGKTTIYLFVISLLILAMCAFFVYNNASKKYYENTNRMNEKIMTAQKDYYESLLERESDTRKFRHDINNHMFCIKTLIDEGKYEEAEQYITGIDDKMDKLRNKYSTGNSLVNAIVNDIAGKYDGVELDWQGVVPEDLKISNMDVCIIFSNLLDNAFCAAAGCEKNKNVAVTIKSVANSLMMTIKNNISAPIKTQDSRLITSKPDKKNHGLGTMNVKECVAVNGGSVEYNYTDKDFTVDVVLPNVVNI